MCNVGKGGGIFLTVLALLALFAGPVMAQGQPSDANMAQLDIGDGMVRFDVRGRPLADGVHLGHGGPTVAEARTALIGCGGFFFNSQGAILRRL